MPADIHKIRAICIAYFGVILAKIYETEQVESSSSPQALDGYEHDSEYALTLFNSYFGRAPASEPSPELRETALKTDYICSM